MDTIKAIGYFLLVILFVGGPIVAVILAAGNSLLGGRRPGE